MKKVSALEYFSNIARNMRAGDEFEAEEAANKLRRYVMTHKLKQSNWQPFMDWLVQPVSFAKTREQAEADVIVMKGYQEALAIRDAARIPQEHKHIHFHFGEEVPEVAREKVRRLLG